MKKVLAMGLTALFLATGVLVGAADDGRLQHTIQYVDSAIELDGVITEQEWGAPLVTFTPEDEHAIVSLEEVDEASQEAAMEALPAEVSLYIRWDEENLYVGMQVEDAVHYNPDTPNRFETWIGDSLEFDVGVDTQNQSIRWRNNFARTANGSQYGLVYGIPSATGVQGAEQEVQGDYAIGRSDTLTTYEIAFPWSVYKAQGSTIGNGYKLYVNPQLHIADGITYGTGQGYEAYLGFLRYGTAAENGTLFPMLTLAGGETESESSAPSSTPGGTESSAPSSPGSESSRIENSSSEPQDESSADSNVPDDSSTGVQDISSEASEESIPQTGGRTFAFAALMLAAASGGALVLIRKRK